MATETTPAPNVMLSALNTRLRNAIEDNDAQAICEIYREAREADILSRAYRADKATCDEFDALMDIAAGIIDLA